MYGLCVQGPAFCIIFCGNPPVIHILACILSVLFQEWSKVSSHGPLEEGWHIAHSEVHYFRNIGSMACLYGHLVLVFFCQSDIVISMSYVKFGEEHFSFKLLHCFSYPQHWVVVPNCPSVHSSVFCSQ